MSAMKLEERVRSQPLHVGWGRGSSSRRYYKQKGAEAREPQFSVTRIRTSSMKAEFFLNLSTAVTPVLKTVPGTRLG